MNAKQAKAALLAAQARDGRRAWSAGLDVSSWTWLGPGSTGGRIRAILVDPTQPNRMWIGSVAGGIWSTTNGGQSWQAVNDFMASLSIGAMAMHPAHPDVLYAGTGEGFFDTDFGSSNTSALAGAGIFRSDDSGATWNQLPSTDTEDFDAVNRIAIDPEDQRVLLAATRTGIFRSEDAGATWSQRTTARTLDLNFHPTDGSQAVAGRADGVAQYSIDGGRTWSDASGLTGLRVEVAYAPSDPRIVYAAVSSPIRIWRSSDGGRTDTLQTSGTGISSYSLYNTSLWVNPTDADNLFVGGVKLHRSYDGGATLDLVQGGHDDYHVLVEHPAFDGAGNKTLFVGDDGGIHRIADVDAPSTSPVTLNHGLGITQFYGGAFQAGTDVVIGGAQDNGTLRFDGDVERWGVLFGADGANCFGDPADPDYLYGAIQHLGLFRSSDGGSSATRIGSGIMERHPNFAAPFILDPNNSNLMLAGGAGLWRSSNVKSNSPSWSSIKAPLDCEGEGHTHGDGAPLPIVSEEGTDHFAENPPCNISTIAVAVGDPNLIWVGHNNGDLYLSRNGTSASPTWTKMDDNDPPLPNRWLSRIAIDPNAPNRVYVTFLGFAQDNIWRTTDGGVTWSQISGTGMAVLPALPVSALALHPTIAGRIYLGTHLGVFSSDDDGTTWTTSNQGPANVWVEQLVFQNDTLLAVTLGRGMYKVRAL